MILHIDYDTTRIAVVIKHWPSGKRATDWRKLSLAIIPGQKSCENCGGGGSPWYLWGCWPGKPTGVDVANPPAPDFEPYFIPAFELDADGRIVFILPERWRAMAYGRYTGEVWFMDNTNISLPDLPQIPKLPDKYKTPVLYSYKDCNTPPEDPPIVLPPPEPACVLASFDIDYGYKCSEHIIQEAAIDVALSACEEDL